MDKLLRLSGMHDIPIFLTNFKERYIIIQMMVVFRENGRRLRVLHEQFLGSTKAGHINTLRHSMGLDV